MNEFGMEYKAQARKYIYDIFETAERKISSSIQLTAKESQQPQKESHNTQTHFMLAKVIKEEL